MLNDGILNRLQRKINKDCTVETQKVVALATIGKNLFSFDVNRRGEGIISDFSTHAEERLVNKLRKINAQYRFRDKLTFFVIRFRRIGGLGLAKPCDGCKNLLRYNGIKEIFYSTNEGSFERMRLC